ncbi:hypothetical protein SAY87_024175 [Trapa incisa]|uniref:Uncharacterized protein n=1 Tax=Trapa incisa TaxID=236973 RepID=A0AAN7L1V2_9MYRT|nr:hypothetical protein SAY87_024175 [Trapa incisa]
MSSATKSKKNPMERANRIMRRSIFTFLKNIQHFTFCTRIILLLLPFSVSSLIMQALFFRRSLGPLFHHLPSSVCLLSSCFAASVFFLVKAKSSILQILNPPEEKAFLPCSSGSWVHHKPLLQIQSSSLLLLCLFSVWYGSMRSLLQFHVTILLGTIHYMICTNVTVVFNLAFVMSKTQNLPACAAIQEAIFMKIRDPTTMLLALASSTGYAAIEALFRYRVVRAPSVAGRSIEGLLIAYLYSVIIVLDTIACFLVVSGCGREPKSSSASNEIETEDVENLSSPAEVRINL